MATKPNLYAIPDEADEIRALLRARAQIDLAKAENDRALRDMRRRFADRRGEFMLPTIERLKRELL